MAFADQLKKILHNRGMRAVDLARVAQLSEAAISDYLKGKKEPRGRQSIAIAQALHVSLDTLWETDFCDDEHPAQLDPCAQQVVAIFHQLEPEFQGYALEQIGKLLELQNKHKR